MSHPRSTRTVGRTVVVGIWLATLVVAAESVWLAVLVGVALTLVWAAPFLLVTNRLRGSVRRSDDLSRSSQ